MPVLIFCLTCLQNPCECAEGNAKRPRDARDARDYERAEREDAEPLTAWNWPSYRLEN